MDLLIWLLPLIFMFHDFEEILMMQPWIERNSQTLEERFPKVARKILPYYHSLTASAFALIIGEEFLVISIATVITAIYHTYWLWFAAFMGFSIHIFIHVFQWAVFRRYVPVIVTSMLSLPYCIYSFWLFASSKVLTTPAMILTSVFGFLGVVLNYLFASWIAKRFNRWLTGYLSIQSR